MLEVKGWGMMGAHYTYFLPAPGTCAQHDLVAAQCLQCVAVHHVCIQALP
jgi:hypothetical protein